MRNGAEPLFPPKVDAVPPPLALRVVPPEDAEARAALVHRLAADRLRELRDDGVTLAYVARMYDVEPDLLERVHAELLPGRPR